MDALAHYRRSQGLKALTVNWGAWSEIGAATRGGVVERLETQGVRRIDPASGIAALEHLMGVDSLQVAVFPIVWPEFLAHALPPQRLFCEAFAPLQPAAVAASTKASASLEEIVGASPARARSLLLSAVEREATKVLGLDPAIGIDPRQPLNELGLDSLMAVELRTAVGNLIGKPQPATLLFNYPSIGELVDYLAAAVNAGAASPSEAMADVEAAADVDTGELDGLSEDELATLLASKLGDPQADGR